MLARCQLCANHIIACSADVSPTLTMCWPHQLYANIMVPCKPCVNCVLTIYQLCQHVLTEYLQFLPGGTVVNISQYWPCAEFLLTPGQTCEANSVQVLRVCQPRANNMLALCFRMKISQFTKFGMESNSQSQLATQKQPKRNYPVSNSQSEHSYPTLKRIRSRAAIGRFKSGRVSTGLNWC